MASGAEQEVLLILKRVACDIMWLKDRVEEQHAMLLSLGAQPPSLQPTAGHYVHNDSEHGSAKHTGETTGPCDP